MSASIVGEYAGARSGGPASETTHDLVIVVDTLSVVVMASAAPDTAKERAAPATSGTGTSKATDASMKLRMLCNSM